MKRSTTVFVADHWHVVRHGVCAALQRNRSVRVVGEADNGRDAAKACKRLKPDVVIADIYMPRLNGLELARQMKDEHVDSRILLFTDIDRDAYNIHINNLELSVWLGVAGFVVKTAPVEVLHKAIAAIASGAKYYSQVIKDQIDQFSRIPDWGKRETVKILSERERQVIKLIADGYSNKAIGYELEITCRTVENHIQNIMEKLGVNNRAAIAIFGIQAGMSRGARPL